LIDIYNVKDISQWPSTTLANSSISAMMLIAKYCSVNPYVAAGRVQDFHSASLWNARPVLMAAKHQS
jgi:hypothetical protein